MLRRISVVMMTTSLLALIEESPVCSPHLATPNFARMSTNFWLDKALRGVV